MPTAKPVAAAAKPAPVRVAPPPKPLAAASKPTRFEAPATAPTGPAQAKRPEALFTTLADAKALFDRGQTAFVDARHHEDYEAGHIAGALSLFVDDIDARYGAVLGSVPKDWTIVTYCSDPQCEAAVKLADALVARGHTRVFILLDGLPGWTDAGYPTRNGASP